MASPRATTHTSRSYSNVIHTYEPLILAHLAEFQLKIIRFTLSVIWQRGFIKSTINQAHQTRQSANWAYKDNSESDLMRFIVII